ncbi:MAG: DNA-3-methyladenine glycosylase [Planctomycetota bacterium]|nr:DNA-3-methyladenine glycosylase [Planctomycetota bacterium]
MAHQTLGVAFFQHDVRQVARELIGKTLVSRWNQQRVSGMIVETEAYLPKGDSACHAWGGPNRKNASMFGPAGCAYVYTIHARHCFNVVTQDPGVPSAVLIRAVEPLTGINRMQLRRSQQKRELLTKGPARLCEAFGIDRQLDGVRLGRGRHVWIEDNPDIRLADHAIRQTRRIGVTSAQRLRLRFVLRGNRFVSGPRSLG